MQPASDERTPDGSWDAGAEPVREQLMTVASADRDGALVVTVRGEVDGLTAPRLRSALAAAFDRLDGRPLVIDLAGVALLGSPGLRILKDCADEAVHHRGLQPLRIVVDETRPVIRPIEIVGLDLILALYPSVEVAVAAP